MFMERLSDSYEARMAAEKLVARGYAEILEMRAGSRAGNRPAWR